MPVIDDQGRLQGMLMLKDFVKTYHLEELL